MVFRGNIFYWLAGVVVYICTAFIAWSKADTAWGESQIDRYLVLYLEEITPHFLFKDSYLKLALKPTLGKFT